MIFLHRIKDLGNQKRKKKKEEDLKRFEVSKPNPDLTPPPPPPNSLVFGLEKTPNLNKSVFIGCSKLFLVVVLK